MGGVTSKCRQPICKGGNRYYQLSDQGRDRYHGYLAWPCRRELTVVTQATAMEIKVLTAIAGAESEALATIITHWVTEEGQQLMKLWNVPGKPLTSIRTQLSPDAIHIIATQLLSALFYLHIREYAHGNITLHSVIVHHTRSILRRKHRYQATLVDMSHATTHKRPQHENRKITTTTAPELFPCREEPATIYNVGKPKPKVDMLKADVYSLGAVVFYMLFGNFPRDPIDALNTLNRVELKPSKGCSHGIRVIPMLGNMMQRAPEERKDCCYLIQTYGWKDPEKAE